MKARILLGALGAMLLGTGLFLSGRSEPRSVPLPKGVGQFDEVRFADTGQALEPAAIVAPATEAAGPTARAPRERDEVAAAHETTLEVAVVGFGTGEPLSGLRVFLTPGDPRPSWGARYVGTGTARLGEAPLTDALGRVRFTLPPGIPLNLNVLSAPVGTSNLELPVEPLSTGETRVVTAEVALKKSLVFFGRVVDGQDKMPIPGARVRVLERRYEPHVQAWLESDDFHEVLVDSSGAFRLPRGSDLIGVSVEVEFPGYMPRIESLEGRHTDPKHPQTFALLLPASLRLRFLRADESPVTDLAVTLIGEYALSRGSRRPRLDERFEAVARVNSAGECEFQRVPANSPLHLRVQRTSVPPEQRARADKYLDAARSTGVEPAEFSLPARLWPVLHRDWPPLVLDPGERRDSVIVIEAGTEVSGKLVDAEGRPVPRAWVPIRGARELDGFQGFDYLTDGEGRFRIPDVGPGTFLIEPEDAAQRITIVPGTRVPELQLEVSRDD